MCHFSQWIDQSHECHVWVGGKDKDGYGIYRPPNSGKVRAHRFAYESSVGPIPHGMFVCHSCDNPSCVRPEHLFVGTPRDNHDDMVEKGRRGRPSAKLREGDVLAIRARHRSGDRQIDIAADYGLSQASISAITRRKTWQWVA